jgi:hypothetical protein
VQHVRKSYREGKVNRIRREIDRETALAEELYRARQAAEAEAAAAPTVRKAPR